MAVGERTRLINESSADAERAPVTKGGAADGVHAAPVAGAGAAAAATKPDRLVSLDLFRGVTVWFMILVNNADGSYPILAHSFWNGVTIADFVMPFFLFIVGASVALSFPMAPAGVKPKAVLLYNAFVRSLRMFLLGMFLQGADFPFYDLERIRIMGVLQRIAVVYIVVALVYVLVPRVHEAYSGRLVVLVRYALVWACAVAVLVVYLVIMFGANVPNCPRGSLSTQCNAAQYVDDVILGTKHMYQTPTCQQADPPCSIFDPEGILTTVSAVGSAFIGLAFGLILRHHRQADVRFVLVSWISVALSLLTLGIVLNFVGFPLNKNLYSTSYVLLCAGSAGCLLWLFYIVTDLVRWRRVSRILAMPWVCMGMNAIILYFGDEFLPVLIGDRFSSRAVFYWSEPTNSLGMWLWRTLYVSYLPDNVAAFLWALTDVSFWIGVAALLYRFKIFFKI